MHFSLAQISKKWDVFEKKATKNFTKTQLRLWDMTVFVTSFMILAIPFHFALWANFDAYFLQLLTAKSVASFISLLGISVELKAHIIYLPSFNWTVEIIKDCIGWKSLMALWGLMFATRGIEYIKKFYGGLAGIPIIFAGNVTRISTSIWLSSVFGIEMFPFIHDVLWQWGLIALVLGIWRIWVKRASG